MPEPVGLSGRSHGTTASPACVFSAIACGPFHGVAYLPALQNAFVASRALVAAEPSAGVVGFLTVQARNGYVDHLFVQEDWRLCGVGRGLLEIARSEAAKPLILDVDMQNVAARRAYETMGWQVVVDAKPMRPGQQVRLISP